MGSPAADESSESFSDEQWAVILKLARSALEAPSSERQRFLQKSAPNSAIAHEAFRLAAELEEPEQEESPQPSMLVGRYELLRCVGSGGGGEVYAAHDPELNRTVAVKLLRRDTQADVDSQKLLLREARAASALTHQNVITVHEVIQDGPRIAIVMELLSGDPLRVRCGRAMSERELIDIGGQVADGLAAAHAAGVVHRDIKPENIMLVAEGGVKILDFGIARNLHLQDGNTATVPNALPAGTPKYMSPEHVRLQKPTAASDVFALGLVLYELAAGRHPFERSSPVEVLHAIANETAAPLRKYVHISPDLATLIEAMINKNPQQRPSAAAVKAELERLSSTSGRTLAGRRANSARVLATIAAGLLVAILTATILTRAVPRPQYGTLTQITTLVPENYPTASAISRDGKLIAYANRDGVFLQTLGSRELIRLNVPPDFTVESLSWLADDAGLIASGLSDETNQTSIWSLRPGGYPVRLRMEGRRAAVSPDGSQIAFLNGDYSGVSLMTSDGGEQRRLISTQGEDAVLIVSWSGDGQWLVLQRRTHTGLHGSGTGPSERQESYVLDSASAMDGHVADSIPDSSTRSMVSVPSNEVVFLRGLPTNADNGNTLWKSKIDAATGRFQQRMVKIDADLEPLRHAKSVSLSADGSRLAVLADPVRESTFVADFRSNPPEFRDTRELTLDGMASYPHSWTHDSRSILFESNRSGGYDLYRQQLNARIPEAIVTTPRRWEVLPQLAPDRKTVLYAAGPADGGARTLNLMAVPVTGGASFEVSGGSAIDDFRCSVGTRGRCVLRKTLGTEWYTYHPVDPVRGVGPELARTRWMPSLRSDWDVSPDGKTVILPNHDLRVGRLRLVSLDGGPETQLDVPDIANLSSGVWAGEEQAWFITITATHSVAPRMYYYRRGGRPQALGAIRGWAVPSPDGRKVAFLNAVHHANVWLLTRN